MNSEPNNQNILMNQPGKVGPTCVTRQDEPKLKQRKPAWPGVLHAMCKKGLSESGSFADTVEHDWFKSQSPEVQVDFIQTMLDAALEELPSLPVESSGIASVPSIDLLAKNCLASVAKTIAMTAKASTGLLVVSKSGKMIQFVDHGFPTSTASGHRELLKKIAKESALKLVPRVSSSILTRLVEIHDEKSTPLPPDPTAESIDPREPLLDEQQPLEVVCLELAQSTAEATSNAAVTSPAEVIAKPEAMRFAGSVFLNELSQAIDRPLVAIPFRLENSSGVVVLLVEVRSKGEPALPIDEILAEAEHLWMKPSVQDALLKQLDAWYFIQRANVFMRTLGTLDWIRSQPRLWLSLLGLVCVLLIAPVPYYPRRECVFEPESKQFLSSPMQGRIASCGVRPGDNVIQGQLLARLDDDQLQRDLAAARADFDGAEKKRDSALATRAAANAGIADIEMEQARLKIQSLEEQLRRLEIRATKDGVLVQGDWHRNVGMPVTLGQSLFEVAELESMTAEVRLNAYDLELINVGDEVVVRSDASGGESFHGRISRIEPRAIILDDNAVFIADVVIRDPQRMLRPGMKANAQITAGWKPLGWLLFVRPYRWIANQWIW